MEIILIIALIIETMVIIEIFKLAWNSINDLKKNKNTIYIMSIEYIIICSLICLEIIANIFIILFCIKSLKELNNIRDF